MFRSVKILLFMSMLCVACNTDVVGVSDITHDVTADDAYLAGNDVTELVLPDCDGNMHRLHDLCGAKAGFVNLLSGG